VILSLLSLTVAGALLGAQSDSAVGGPRAVVRQARLAVEGDSGVVVGGRWSARLARDSTDREALLGIATLARLTYDYPLSERLYRRLYSANFGGDLYPVYARLGLGQGFEEYGRMQEVDGLFVDALAGARGLGDRAAEGEALLWLGNIRAVSHGLEASIALLDSALRVLPLDAADLRIQCRCRRAQLLFVMGRADAAAELRAASQLARGVENPRAEAPCIRARAIELGHRGQGDSAAALYAAFAEQLSRVRDRSARGRALTWRAMVMREDLADYGGAREELYRAQADADATHNLYSAAIAKLFLGQLFLALNDQRTAAGYLDHAVADAEAVADSEALMVARSWRALASLAAGDLDRARRETLGTVEFFRREGDLENQSEVARTLANIAMRERDWATAERELDGAEVLLRRLGTSAWRTEQPLERGRLALYRGDLPRAERSFLRYLGGLDSASHLRRFEAKAYLADTYARRGDIERAERELTAGSDDLDRWRATLSAQDLRIAAFQAGSSAQNDRNSSVARVLAALAVGGRADAAFALAERRRARELHDHLVQNAALEAGHGQAVEQGSGQESGTMTASDAAGLLPDDQTALLEYVTGALDAPTSVFVLTRGRTGPQVAQARVLPSADSVTGTIGRFIALLAKGEDPGAAGRQLSAALLEPALAILPPQVTRLIIVPDGPLHRVPWDALRLADGRYLVERYAVGIVPSAATLRVLRRRTPAPSTAPTSLLAFGDPTFSSDTTGDARLFAGVGGLARLPASGDEARSVARYAAASEVRLRKDASEDYLLRAPLAGFGVIHFATHAIVDDRALNRTVLALAPGGAGDGFVTPGQLATLRLSAAMVVLSACRTAGGVVVDGEGVQGLTAPLLEAGARSIVATAWRVSDRATAGFVERFYRQLAEGKPVVEALRDTRLASMRAGEPAKVWAAFSVVGDPMVTILLRTPASATSWWVFGSGLVVALVVAAARRRRLSGKA
jgi:hypothetical protein